MHAGFEGFPNRRLECTVGDVDTLRLAGLISFLGKDSFYLAPSAFTHYEQTKQQAGEPVQRVENEMRSYLDAHRFRAGCPTAFEKWTAASVGCGHPTPSITLPTLVIAVAKLCNHSRLLSLTGSNHPRSIPTSNTM